jgi:hypothetical protein
MSKKNKKQTSRSKDEKVTNEKPVSLYPLNFKEAVAALLKVKPKPKEEPKEQEKLRQEKPND